MHTIFARNVHDVLPQALAYLQASGIPRDSRNGPVLIAPGPVTTVYDCPCERVLFWPERDANPFFHLYESLWMLAGRNDIQAIARYAKQMLEYSDDGKTQHGAYGFRWRNAYDPMDQLVEIARALKKNKDDRRCVLQMWDATADLGQPFKDVPCNVAATFQINCHGALDLTVFCRSNDIVWGAYGANAVHFSFLLEYMAVWIGVPVGRMYQVSVNWHGYRKTFDPLYEKMKVHSTHYTGSPYGGRTGVYPLLFPRDIPIEDIDARIRVLLRCADEGIQGPYWGDEFFDTVDTLLQIHHHWKTENPENRYEICARIFDNLNGRLDWVRACREWIDRRQVAYLEKRREQQKV
jgi:hypothetical protein